MKYDEKGRFEKIDEESLEIIFGLTHLKRMLTWFFIIGLLMIWISIIQKNNSFQILMDVLDKFVKKQQKKQLKRMDYFLNSNSYLIKNQ